MSVIILALLACTELCAKSPVTPVVSRPERGLAGRNIALWNSHGLYYNPERQAWIFQRAHLMQTIEDLYTSSYVIDLLVPMLEDAGAYVMMPRERDLSDVEVIIDADSPLTTGYSEQGAWQTGGVGFKMPSGYLTYKDNPFAAGKVRRAATTTSAPQAATAEWNAPIPRRGDYAVYISYASLPESAADVHYTVNSLRGDEEFVVDQTMGGGTWIYLGTFPLAEGLSDKPIVSVSTRSSAAGKVVTADAVKIGGGMGNVARSVKNETPTVSGRPRWMEGSRYWLQWAGAPDTVYSETDFEKDYSDDFKSRPLWVNWLAGGSSKMPNDNGLGIPIDVSLAIHTDAGTTPDSTIVGTFGIFCTDGGKRLGDGRRRTTNRDLTEAIVNSMVEDIRALHNPEWTKRRTRDRKYAEARLPKVPAALVEMLSHQNFADMRHGQDPQFRFDVSRAIYKGILRYLYQGSKMPYVVTPLPVNSMAVKALGGGKYKLTWRPTADPLEKSADASSYIIEQLSADGDYREVARTGKPSWEYTAREGEPASFRVRAVNAGGRSFPSETVSLCYIDNGNPEVLIVNGFTRISSADWMEADSIAGFLDRLDYGVPYMRNIAYSGSQYNFDRSSPWVDDIVDPGFGASETDFDGRPVAGNTFDYSVLHGKALANAGYPYVSVSLKAFTDSAYSFNNPIIDLVLGKQKEIQAGAGEGRTRFKAFPPNLQRRLAKFVKSGGSLLVSGEFIGTDLLANPFADEATAKADARFASETLGIELLSAFAAVSGQAEILPFWANSREGRSMQYSASPNGEKFAVGSPDAIQPVADDGLVIASFSENSHPAGVASRRGKGKAIVLTIPIESVFDEADVDYMMSTFMRYLTPRRQPIAPRPALLDPLPEPTIEIPTQNPDNLKPCI